MARPDQQGGSISFAIFDDRLEITSTGGLHFGLTVEDLTRPHTSQPWNPSIANFFYLRGIIETWGAGYDPHGRIDQGGWAGSSGIRRAGTSSDGDLSPHTIYSAEPGKSRHQ